MEGYTETVLPATGEVRKDNALTELNVTRASRATRKVSILMSVIKVRLETHHCNDGS